MVLTKLKQEMEERSKKMQISMESMIRTVARIAVISPRTVQRMMDGLSVTENNARRVASALRKKLEELQ